ncbi:MAG: hypothetical protein LC772_05540, partial [Chloroflexi bacterium]|nr:hypothetical protein [Chloroflexota bacterium]
PVLPQIEIAQGRSFTIDLLDAHTHHFSYGENFGAADCEVPVKRFHYEPTRQPVVLDWWSGTEDARLAAQAACFTTVANWQQSGKDLEWEGETYSWSKHHEFLKLLDLPSRTEECLQLALACGDPKAIALLTSNGWRVTDAIALSRDISTYRSFIQDSRGEFTVAKDQNVRLRSGWFSDRSACYLASARPVITQDTGFGNILPTGRGLFAFRTIDDVVEAMDSIRTCYPEQCQAALEIAREYFAAEKVLGSLIERAGLR